MNLKKIILIILLAFSIISLGIIVYFAKSKSGFFAKAYSQYITNQIQEIGSQVQDNLVDMTITVKTLADGALPRSVFESIGKGEGTERYLVDFERVMSGIPFSKKIHIVDMDGKVVFSTIAEEINELKVKQAVLAKFFEHFQQSRDPYIYFLNADEVLAVSPYVNPSRNTIEGFALIYYDNKALLQGIEDKDLKVPFSIDQYMILAREDKVDSQEIDKIVTYMTEDTHPEYTGRDQTIALASANMNGIKVILYTRNMKYMPWVAIVFVLVNLILMGLVIFVLLQSSHDEKEKEDYFLPKNQAERSYYEDEEKPYTTHAVSPDMAHALEEEEYTAVRMSGQSAPVSESYSGGSDNFEEMESPLGGFDEMGGTEEEFGTLESPLGGFEPAEEPAGMESLGEPETETLPDMPDMSEMTSDLDNLDEIKPFESPNQEEIQELVDDIDSGIGFNSETAHKGIEEMIMSEDGSLLDMSAGFGEETESGLPDLDSGLPTDTAEAEPLGMELPEDMMETGGALESVDFGEMSDMNVPTEPEPGFEPAGEPIASVEDFAMPEEPLTGDSALFAPSEETEMFAEHERIIGDVDDSDLGAAAEGEETASFDFDLEMPETEPEAAPEMLETPDFGEMSMTEEQTSAETMETPDFGELPQIGEPDLDLADISEEGLADIELPISEEPAEELELPPSELKSEMEELDTELVQIGGQDEIGSDFDIDAAMAILPSLDGAAADEDDEQITLAPDELAAITTDLDMITEIEGEPGDNAQFEPADLDFSEVPLDVEEPPMMADLEPIPEMEALGDEPEPVEPDFGDIGVIEEPDMDAIPVDIEEAPEELISIGDLDTPIETIPAVDIEETPADIEEIVGEVEFHMPEPEELPIDIDDGTFEKMVELEDSSLESDVDGIDLDKTAGKTDMMSFDDDSGIIEIDASDLGDGDLLEVSQDEYSEPEELPMPDTEMPEFDLDSMMQNISGVDQSADEDDDSIALDASQLAAIEVDETPVENKTVVVMDTFNDEPAEPKANGNSSIDFAKLFNEPPVKISTIGDVDSYAKVAMDLAINNLGLNKVNILKKTSDGFSTSENKGFLTNIAIPNNDPLYEKFLSKKKSVDIRGDLSGAKYLQNIFKNDDLSKLEELIIVPIVKDESIEGVAVYGRDKGINEPTSFQKSELHNLGFLQQE